MYTEIHSCGGCFYPEDATESAILTTAYEHKRDQVVISNNTEGEGYKRLDLAITVSPAPFPRRLYKVHHTRTDRSGEPRAPQGSGKVLIRGLCPWR